MENKFPKSSEELKKFLYHGKEETYLEYKGDISWNDRKKKLEIVQTIFALANEKEGGVIIIGVNDNGERIGLSEENYNSFSHDTLNKFLNGKGNQPIHCKLSKEEIKEGEKLKKFVFIQVQESKEFPLVYIGETQTIKRGEKAYPENIGLRKGALYIRNKRNIGNKEITDIDEWQELIERTYKKYEKETIRRYKIIKEKNVVNPYNNELTI
ncbi:hypothetical protein HRbin34_00615 [bacterium HR34]|nr:hypothetical protein HRbin34_00615 [bacterium HR34]